MSVKYYRDSEGNYIGAFSGVVPDAGVEVSSPPLNASAKWNGSGWDEPVVNYTTASKLKILAYFDAQGETVRNQFLAVLKSDDFLYEQWLAANEIDISHPAIPTVRDAMGWTQQQVQGLFNALNTQQA